MQLEHQNPPPTDADHGIHDRQEIVGALQSVVSDVDTFLTEWMGRLEQVVETTSPTATAEGILRKRYDELQNQKRIWEAKCKTKERELQEKAEQLTKAWLRLEDEQRKLLQAKKSQPQVEQLSEPVRARANESDPMHSGSASPTDRLESFPTTEARDSAVRQFQQLRREIESSRPQDRTACGFGEQN